MLPDSCGWKLVDIVYAVVVGTQIAHMRAQQLLVMA